MIEPLANVLIAEEPDPGRSALLCARLRESGAFDEVGVHGAWVVGVKRLPDTLADEAGWRDHGLIFAEGRGIFGDARGLAAQVGHEPATLGRWPGDFTFFHVEGPEITAVRSVAGRIPVYFWRSSGRWILSTRFEHAYLAAVRPARLDPDPLCCAMALLDDFAFPGTRSPLRDVGQVPRAQFMRFTRNGERQGGAYWTPPQVEPRLPTAAEERATVERFRGALLEELGRQSHPTRPNLLAFSGGVDSSALAYLLHKPLGRRLWTVSMAHDERTARQHQLSYVNPVLKDCAVERAAFVTWDDAAFVAGLERPRHVRYPAFEGILRVVAEQRWPEAPATLIGGDLGDEICGSVRTYPDWSLCTGPRELWQLRDRWPAGPRAVPRWAKHRVLSRLGRPLVPRVRELPGFFSRSLREEYRDEYAAAITRWQSAAPRRTYLLAAMDVFCAGAAVSWELACARGVRIVLPFVSRDLMTLALGCHPCIQVGPDLRRLLQLAFHGEVGARSLSRRDKGVVPYDYAPRRYSAPAAGWSPFTLDMISPATPQDLAGLASRDAQLLRMFDHLVDGVAAERPAVALPRPHHQTYALDSLP